MALINIILVKSPPRVKKNSTPTSMWRQFASFPTPYVVGPAPCRMCKLTVIRYLQLNQIPSSALNSVHADLAGPIFDAFDGDADANFSEWQTSDGILYTSSRYSRQRYACVRLSDAQELSYQHGVCVRVSGGLNFEKSSSDKLRTETF